MNFIHKIDLINLHNYMECLLNLEQKFEKKSVCFSVRSYRKIWYAGKNYNISLLR